MAKIIRFITLSIIFTVLYSHMIYASNGSSYETYNTLQPLSNEKIGYVGPDIVGPTGLRGFQYGLITVFFIQGETDYRYKWFITDSERAYLVKKITEVVYQMPYNVLKDVKPGEISFVILPPKMEQYSRMGNEPWVTDIIGRACGSRIEVREIFFIDWERNKDILSLFIFHELTHLLTARRHLEDTVAGAELDKEVFADVAAMTWHKMAKHEYPVPKNDSEYEKLLEQEFQLQKPSFLEANLGGEDVYKSPIVKKIADEYKEQFPEKKIWGQGVASLSEDYYKGYNFMVNLELTDGSAVNYVANKQTMSYSILTEDLYKKSLFDSFDNKKEYLSEKIINNLLSARDELAGYLLVKKFDVFPVSIEKHDSTLDVIFTMQLFHKNWGKCFFSFPYAISETSYKLVKNISPEPIKAETIEGF